MRRARLASSATLLLAPGSTLAACSAAGMAEIYRDADAFPRIADVAYVDAHGLPCGRSRQEVGDAGSIVFEYDADEQLAFYYVHGKEDPDRPAQRTYFSAKGEVLFVETRDGATSHYRDASDAVLTQCEMVARLPALPLHPTWNEACRPQPAGEAARAAAPAQRQRPSVAE